MSILQVTVPVAGPTMKEIAKNPPAPQDAKENKGSAKKKGDKGAEKAPVKEKPKRKGPLDVLPHNTEEWAVYDVPDEVRFFFFLKYISHIPYSFNSWVR